MPYLTSLDPVCDLETVGGTLQQARRRWPDRDALIIGARTASYEALWAEASACAKALIGLGVKPGANIGIYLPNCWEYVVLFHAISMVGGCAVALNARFRERDLAYALQKAEISVLFTAGTKGGHFDGLSVVKGALPELSAWTYPNRPRSNSMPALGAIIDIGGEDPGFGLSWSSFLDMSSTTSDDKLAAQLGTVRADQDCLIMFSSGTTADPKACRLSHRALNQSAAGLAKRFELVPEDRFWNPLPFFHMSTMLPMAACRQTGACFIGVKHFEPAVALSELVATKATIAYPAFATITAAMISHPDFSTRDLSRLRLILNVGPADLLLRFQSAFPKAVQISCYGLTECGGLSFYNELSETLEQRVTTSGRAIDGVEVRIAEAQSGAVLPPGERGEIQLRGTTLFSGYYNGVAQTAEAMTKDGWLRTGDIGTLDADGRLSYVGRLKDMLRVGGENVAAAEIESYLLTHPAIKLAQVIGVPDERLDEVPAAFIELTTGARIEEIDVARYCAHRIANFKIPRYVRFVSEWPMSATKIQKFRLKSDFIADRKIDLASLLNAAKPD